MRIEEDIKLDYADVLFRPKRSTLSSRKDVELVRTYKFKYSNHQWKGTPIIAANMDGVGELEVAKSLAEFEIMTCLTKQHDLKAIFLYIDLIFLYCLSCLISCCLVKHVIILNSDSFSATPNSPTPVSYTHLTLPTILLV